MGHVEIRVAADFSQVTTFVRSGMPTQAMRDQGPLIVLSCAGVGQECPSSAWSLFVETFQVHFFLTVTDCGVETPTVLRVALAERTPILVGRRGQL